MLNKEDNLLDMHQILMVVQLQNFPQIQVKQNLNLLNHSQNSTSLAIPCRYIYLFT